MCQISAVTSSKVGVDMALADRFGVDLEDRKKLHFLGGEVTPGGYDTKMPVVSICSKDRHIPPHARGTELADDSNESRFHLLDLHSSETPIHAAAMSTTLRDAGLLDLCADNTLELYGVVRAVSPTSALSGLGKDSIFRARSHFEPPVRQSTRGVAMFLSTTRVVASVLQDMNKDDPAGYDAVLHVFDLLTGFPPALRALHLLSQGKIPSAAECVAFSHSVFAVLQTSMPTELVGTERNRLFEGARLLFGFVFEKARSVKLTAAQPDSEDGQDLPYLSAFTEREARDCKTNEPLMHPVATRDGLVERAYLEAKVVCSRLFLCSPIFQSLTCRKTSLVQPSAVAAARNTSLHSRPASFRRTTAIRMAVT